MKQILLVMIGLSLHIYAAFTTVGQPAGVVKDTVTGLQWQDDYSDNNGTVKIATWTAAIDYCEASTLGGYTDWRLPNKKELLSLVDYSRVNPSIDPSFTPTTSYVYWSSTTYAGNTANAWIVHFYRGDTVDYNKANTNNVRCVR